MPDPAVEITEKFVIRGTDLSLNLTVDLVRYLDEVQARAALEHWSRSYNSAPYSHDVHIERIITTVGRIRLT